MLRINKKSLSRSFIYGLTIVIASWLLVACGETSAPPSVSKPTAANTSQAAQVGSSASARPVVGGTAPDFKATDINGRSFQLSDLRGKVVVLNYWAVY